MDNSQMPAAAQPQPMQAVVKPNLNQPIQFPVTQNNPNLQQKMDGGISGMMNSHMLAPNMQFHMPTGFPQNAVPTQPMAPATQSMAPATQSVENQALGGGGNPQQTQSFLKSLGNQSGTNNAMQNTAANSAANQTGTSAPLYSGAPSGNTNLYGTPASAGGTSGSVNYGNPNPSSTVSYGNPAATPPSLSTSQMINAPKLNLPNNISNLMNGPTSQVGPGVDNQQQVPGQNALPMMNPTVGLTGLPASQSRMNDLTTFGQSQANSNPMNQVGTAITVSDEEAKKEVEQAEDPLHEFLSNLTANSYEYKDKADGEGRFVSPMAQDFEKSKLGSTMVEERPDGVKQVNYGRGLGIITAAQAMMHQRLSQIEYKLKIKGNQ